LTASDLSRESATASFLIYGRVYCHLCQDMELALKHLLQDEYDGLFFSIESIDVDQDESLEERFGERVPVLVAGDRELCHYFLDAEAVRAYLADIR
jgi:Glutaredoxin-like domain (DUF836)